MERLWRWLLMLTILAAFLAIHTDAVKATSLIFGKTSTTSTEIPLDDDPSANGDEGSSGAEKSEHNSTKPTLTGIPQIDYIWDPNLPRELNGYNLSNYPFLNSVPDLEDIEFKCDGLHDGFYASVKYDCQLYHHCLFGIRYDFLCANFTAFDQKTFICHFVSEVDCKNSPKYWHRNDALYEAATTTTQKPPSTTTTTTTTTVAPLSPTPAAPVRPHVRPGRPYRRPYRRRRPQVDYYYEDDDYDDDYYEERINRRRKQRPRPRRPDYDDYEEGDRYDTRPAYAPERSRGKVEDDDYEYDRRFERPRYRPRYDENRRPAYDDRRGYTDRRNPDEGRYRPLQDRRYPDDERRPAPERRKPLLDRRPALSEPATQQRREEDNEKVIKRPIQEEAVKTAEESGKIRPSGSGGSNPLLFAPRTPPKIRRPVPINEREKYEYSTTTSTKAPEIQPPSAADEYYDDEYEEEPLVETIPPAKVQKEQTTEKRLQPAQPQINERVENRRPAPAKEEQSIAQQPRRPQEYEYYGDEYDERPKTTFKKPGVTLRTSTTPPPTPPVSQTVKIPEVEEEEEEDVRPKLTSDRFSSRIPSGSFSFGTARYRPKEEAPEQIETPFRSTQRPLQHTEQLETEEPQYRQANKEKYTQEDFEETYDERVRNPPPSQNHNQEDTVVREVTRPVVRVVKRPFLPSRGGNPVLPRGLQPVGVNSRETATESSIPVDLGSTVSGVRMLEHSPPVLRYPHEHNQSPPISHTPQKFTYSGGPRTTQAPQIDVPKSTLEEIYNSDYDVTLNDALNPTLKPIAPSRAPNLGYSISTPAKLLERSRYSIPYTASGDVHYSSSQLRPAVQLPSAIRRQAPLYSDHRPHVPLYELDY
ncbi:titin isoform X2 [Phlebotomus papatasi]|nr:titin isoform X2 [Phlebotomus papatasi]XP_055702529.1 titin isoform X2 [Phlebotomus papatasi]